MLLWSLYHGVPEHMHVVSKPSSILFCELQMQMDILWGVDRCIEADNINHCKIKGLVDCVQLKIFLISYLYFCLLVKNGPLLE